MMKQDKNLQMILEKHKQTNSKESMWRMLINGIVRPPRSEYSDHMLGGQSFKLNQTTFYRRDHVISHQDKKLVVTTYRPSQQNKWVILYLHGNSSSKLEGTGIIRHLPKGFSLAIFDFMGCGLNKEAETISLGLRQSKQAETVVNYLQSSGLKVVLWGRSMGAVSALLCGKTSIIVADSAFTNFKSLCKEVALHNSPKYFPNCLIYCFFPCVYCKLQHDVKQEGQYDLQDINIKKSLLQIDPSTVMIFMSAQSDTLIGKQNSQKLYELFPGSIKYLELFAGNHNSKRPPQALQKVMSLIQKHALELGKQQENSNHSKTRIQIQMG